MVKRNKQNAASAASAASDNETPKKSLVKKPRSKKTPPPKKTIKKKKTPARKTQKTIVFEFPSSVTDIDDSSSNGDLAISFLSKCLNAEPEITIQNNELEKKLKEQEELINKYQSSSSLLTSLNTRKRIILLDTDIPTRSMLLEKYDNINGKKGFFGGSTVSDKQKFQAWINDVLSIPFEKSIKLPINSNDEPEKIREFLGNIKIHLDNAVAGHENAKDEIIDFISRLISNPSSKGNILALCGSKGCGKTRLIKRGIAEALHRPFHVINLGGLNDVHVLTGHDHTYSASKYGRIAQILINSKCDNPVIYLDEIDKINFLSDKGTDIFRVLLHILDEEQNMEFYDEYFAGIKLNLSKVLFIASLNNADNVDPVLRDRLKIIYMKQLDLQKKIEIAYNHILPELFDMVNFPFGFLNISNDVMKYIITEKTIPEEGCRQMKRKLETIVQRLNTMKLTRSGLLCECNVPLTLTRAMVDELLSHEDMIDNCHLSMYV